MKKVEPVQIFFRQGGSSGSKFLQFYVDVFYGWPLLTN